MSGLTITERELTALRDIVAEDDEGAPGPAIWWTLLEALGSLMGADAIVFGDAGPSDRVRPLTQHLVGGDPRPTVRKHGSLAANGWEHTISTTLTLGPGRFLRLTCWPAPGSGFSERHRFYLTLLRPYIAAAYWQAEGPPEEPVTLTARQTELLRLVSEGYTNRQIARRMRLAEGTVRKHLNNIYGRLGVTSRTAAATKGLGLRPPPSP